MRQIFPCFSVWHLSDCCRFGCRGKDDGNVVERRCYLALERKQNVCVLSWTPHNSHRQTETAAWPHKTCLTLKNGHKADLDSNTTCKCEISLVHGISQVSIAIPKWQKQDMKFSSDKNSWTLKNARTIFSTKKHDQIRIMCLNGLLHLVYEVKLYILETASTVQQFGRNNNQLYLGSNGG